MDTVPSLDPETLLPLLLVILPILFLIALVPTILFNLTLQRALARCAPSSRVISPGQVWLGMIPIFNLVWPFPMVSAISKTLHNEFVRRGMVEEPEPGKLIGMAFATLGLLSVVPLVNFVTCIPMVVCWILYWIKIAEFSRKLAEPFSAAV